MMLFNSLLMLLALLLSVFVVNLDDVVAIVDAAEFNVTVFLNVFVVWMDFVAVRFKCFCCSCFFRVVAADVVTVTIGAKLLFFVYPPTI